MTRRDLKRGLCLTLALILLLALLPGGVLAADSEWSVTTLDDGTLEITGYSGQAGDLVIPERLSGKPVTSIGYHAFMGCLSVCSVTIPKSVTAVNNYAFEYADNLSALYVAAGSASFSAENGILYDLDKSCLLRCPPGKSGTVKLPDSLSVIKNNAFDGCTALTAITIPSGVTEIGSYAFAQCEGLTDITLPKALQYIDGSALSSCTALTDITVAAGNQSFRSVNGVLFNADKTRLVAYPSGREGGYYRVPDTVECITFGAFLFNHHLKRVMLGSSLTKIESAAFWYADSLTAVAIPDSVTSIDYGAFLGCSALTDVYYGGDGGAWSAIALSEENEPLSAAELHLSADIETACTVPRAIDSVTAQAGECVITLRWSEAVNAEQYEVQRRIKGESSWTVLRSDLRETAYEDYSYSSGVEYQYRVRGKNGSSFGPLKLSNVITAPAAAVTPGAVSSLTATAEDGQIVLSWSSAAYALRYEVQRKTRDADHWSVLDAGVAGTSYADSSVVSGAVYQYRVCGIRGSFRGDYCRSTSVRAAASADEQLLETIMKKLMEAVDRQQNGIDLSAYHLTEEQAVRIMEWSYSYCADRIRYMTYRLENPGYASLFYYDLYSDQDMAKFEAAVDRALAVIQPGMSDLQKALVIHDYLILNVAYDYDNYLAGTIPLTSGSAFGPLVLGTGVCSGYAAAYCALLRRCGIPVLLVNSASMDHSWTLVLLDGSWYHVDVTWDDPVRDSPGQAAHWYFLLSDEAVSDADHGHHGWVNGLACVDTRFDDGGFWASLTSGIFFDDKDSCWFLRCSGGSEQLIKRDWGSGEETRKARVSINSIWNGDQPLWWEAFAKLCRWEDRLFFNDARCVYAFDPADGSLEKVYTCADAYVYGLWSDDEGIWLLTGASPEQNTRSFRFTPPQKAPEPEPLALLSLKCSEASAAVGSKLSWTAETSGGSGTLRYRFFIYQGSTQVYADNGYGTANTFCFTPKEAGNYRARVFVRDGDGASANLMSGSVSVVSGAAAAPGAISSVTAKAEAGKTTITWTASEGATAYIIQRRVKDGAAWTTLKSNVAGLSYEDTTGEPGTVYQYRVRGRDGTSYGPFKVSSVVRAQAGSAAPSAPGAIGSVTAKAEAGKTTITWTASEGATAYIIQRRVKDGDTWTTLKSNVTGTSYEDTTGQAGTVYQYRVRGRNGTVYGPFKVSSVVRAQAAK